MLEVSKDPCFTKNTKIKHSALGQTSDICLSSVQFSSVAQSCPTLCDPMDCSTPGFPVHHHLLEPTPTYVHHVGDAIQPPHPLSSPSPPAFSLSQHQDVYFTSKNRLQLVHILQLKSVAIIMTGKIQHIK